MTKPELSTRQNLSLEELIPNTLITLFNCYRVFDPTKGETNFIQEFLVPLAASSEDGDGDSLLKRFMDIQRTDPSANLQQAPLLVSCAYCLQAMKALKCDERDKAWSYMAEASYWCGVSRANTGIEVAREKTIQATRANTAKKGSSARHRGHRELKEQTFRLAREKRPEKGWYSRRQASQRIAPEVIQLSASILGKSLSPNQAEKTIYEWLAQMPDAISLFPRKRGDNG